MSTSTPLQETSEAMTDGQIDKIVDNVRAGLRKRRNDFKSADVQQALMRGQLDKKVIAAAETALEEAIAQVANIIVRTAKVDRTRDPQQALDATGRRQYTDSDVVATMPSGGTGVSENVTVEFFRLGKYVSDDELAKAYEERGLVPNPYAQAAVNEADPEFADEYPNGTHWKDEDDKWCFVAFNRRDVGRDVYVDRYDYVWNDYWWFGGVRK